MRMPRADVGKLLLLGVLGLSASNFFYYLAIQRTSVAMAIMLQYTAPVWVLAYLTAPGGMRTLLEHLGLPTLPGRWAPARGATPERGVLSPRQQWPVACRLLMGRRLEQACAR